ncbi:MAG TPA: ATP-binding cassette domain-containing protein [Candidatus Limnocylindrales bacterium]|nr:ATP-binding cassette domain-containing protein [Candidatus Limnocylindrales bacterium]
MAGLMVEARGLRKRFGSTEAVAGVDLSVPTGSVFGLLGPNGAGKTTTVRILTTLTIPDAGTARVAGHDVVHDPQAVRRTIGVAAQDATLDGALTGRQNLLLVGQLGRMDGREARDRAAELLELFELVEAADRVVRTYSGGMRRRLDLAASLMTRPPMLFLDEPTTGLDPVSRQRVWSVVRGLVETGATVLLTTQYLDEADQLADRIAIVDHGRVIAEDTSAGLKRLTGGASLEVHLAGPDTGAASAVTAVVDAPVQIEDDGRRLRAALHETRGVVARIVRALDERGVEIEEITVHQPSLDDVFMQLTGAAPETETERTAA